MSHLSSMGKGEEIMRILLIIETCGGGSGRHLLDLAQGLVAFGNEVHVAYSPVRAEDGFIRKMAAMNGVVLKPVEMVSSLGFYDIKPLIKLRRYIEQQGPFDIIHGHSSKAGALGRIAAAGTGAGKIYTPHGLYTLNPVLSPMKKKVYGSIEKMLASLLTDKVIVVSEKERNHAIEQGFPADGLQLVVNGVHQRSDEELLTTRARVRNRLNVGPETTVIGFVGRFCIAKAAERFVHLGRSVKENNLDAHLVLLGSGESEDKIDAMIESFGLTDTISVFKNESGEEFMPAFDIYTLTSRYEAMPYVLLEALAAGLPIVATDVGGSRTVIEQGINGYVVPQQDDISEMADRVMMLIKNKDMLSEMSSAARRMAQKFSQDEMVRRTLEVYQQALAC